MVKKCMAVMASALMMVSANAQELKNELSVSWGEATNIELSELLLLGITDAVLGEDPNPHYTGAFTLQYFRNVSPKLWVGGNFTYEHSWARTKNAQGQSELDHSFHYFTLMPAVKYKWVNTSVVGLYSKLGVGITYGHLSSDGDSNDGVVFNYQVTPIGFEIGNTRVRAFSELGWGAQGIIQVGARYNF